MDEFDEGGGLAWTEPVGAEVADEADADSDFVERLAGEVPTLFLLKPAGTDFDLAVARIGAVTDDEVVGHAIFHAAGVTMKIVEDFGIAAAGTAVVDDDVFPISESIFGGIDLGTGRFHENQFSGCRFGRGRGWGWDWGGGNRGRGAKAQEVA